MGHSWGMRTQIFGGKTAKQISNLSVFLSSAVKPTTKNALNFGVKVGQWTRYDFKHSNTCLLTKISRRTLIRAAKLLKLTPN